MTDDRHSFEICKVSQSLMSPPSDSFGCGNKSAIRAGHRNVIVRDRLIPCAKNTDCGVNWWHSARPAVQRSCPRHHLCPLRRTRNAWKINSSAHWRRHAYHTYCPIVSGVVLTYTQAPSMWPSERIYVCRWRLRC